MGINESLYSLFNGAHLTIASNAKHHQHPSHLYREEILDLCPMFSSHKKEKERVAARLCITWRFARFRSAPSTAVSSFASQEKGFTRSTLLPVADIDQVDDQGRISSKHAPTLDKEISISRRV